VTAARTVTAVLLLASACSRRPDVPILTYHSISSGTDGFSVTERAFTSELDALVAGGFHTVTFRDWLEHADRASALPQNPVILTFDDGYEDAYSTALPALRARGMRATFFIVTSLVGADASHRIARDDDGVRHAYLVWPEVRALLAAGMEIGSHGVTHRRFADLTREQARDELARSKQQLEATLGTSVDVFAYPYNSVRRWMQPLVRDAGYRAAVAGGAHGSADRFALYRIGVYAGTTTRQLSDELSRYRGGGGIVGSKGRSPATMTRNPARSQAAR
jgi:peptidoglycan/xylan/chitin deacetylase (PgdA/CDA1 family)